MGGAKRLGEGGGGSNAPRDGWLIGEIDFSSLMNSAVNYFSVVRSHSCYLKSVIKLCLRFCPTYFIKF